MMSLPSPHPLHAVRILNGCARPDYCIPGPLSPLSGIPHGSMASCDNNVVCVKN